MVLNRNHSILVTGGAGFIGSELVRQLIEDGFKHVIVLDKLTYAGDLSRLKEVRSKINFCKCDIVNKTALGKCFKTYNPQFIIHAAAETHIDRSIQDMTPFIASNIMGTQNVIDGARESGVKKFIHISTDEVYGEHRTGRFKETDPLFPNNPYAATKAAAELLVRAAIRTHQFPAVIVRPVNCYGPWQYPEKLIPVTITKALRDERVPVYGCGKQVREWLYVSDCARAIRLVAECGKIGEIYNVGSGQEQDNLKTVQMLLKLLGKPETLIQFVKDRPGHDFRYSVDFGKLMRIGWKLQYGFDNGIAETVKWNMENQGWLMQKKAKLEKYWSTVYLKQKTERK